MVPLECDATVYFSADKKHKLTFDVSFLLPFRQRYEISAVSNRSGTGDKVLYILFVFMCEFMLVFIFLFGHFLYCVLYWSIGLDDFHLFFFLSEEAISEQRHTLGLLSTNCRY